MSAVRKKLELLFLVFKVSPPLRVKKLLDLNHQVLGDQERKFELTRRFAVDCGSSHCQHPLGSLIPSARFLKAFIQLFEKHAKALCDSMIP